MKISILVEGKTEMGFKGCLIAFLQTKLPGKMPKLDFVPYDGRIPKGPRLRRVVENLLGPGKKPADAVIALTDVYTGTHDFTAADDAKRQMQSWVGGNPSFFPHASQHDFEAWLLPFWARIQYLAGHNKAAPAGAPESVNHQNPPSYRIAEIFRIGSRGRAYVKPRDAAKILQGQDLGVSAAACPELKAFLNRIITLCGGEPLA